MVYCEENLTQARALQRMPTKGKDLPYIYTPASLSDCQPVQHNKSHIGPNVRRYHSGSRSRSDSQTLNNNSKQTRSAPLRVFNSTAWPRGPRPRLWPAARPRWRPSWCRTGTAFLRVELGFELAAFVGSLGACLYIAGACSVSIIISLSFPMCRTLGFRPEGAGKQCGGRRVRG